VTVISSSSSVSSGTPGEGEGEGDGEGGEGAGGRENCTTTYEPKNEVLQVTWLGIWLPVVARSMLLSKVAV